MASNLDFTTAFKYPFRRWQGLFNILWVLVPIYGWFLLIGYRVRIVAEFLQGKYQKTPTIQHGDDFVLGWKMFWKAFPGILVLIAGAALTGNMDGRHGPGFIGGLYLLVLLFIVPILAMNFIKKRTVASCFEFDLIRVVFNNFVDYLVALLKDLALGLLFLVMCIILVGFPAAVYTKAIFISEFFRTHVKSK